MANPILTDAGRAYVAAQDAADLPVVLAEFRLGNPGVGGAAPSDPPAAQTTQAAVVWSGAPTAEGIDPANPDSVIYSLLLGTDVGDFEVTQIGLWSDTGVLVYLANIPTFYKRAAGAGQLGNNFAFNANIVYAGIVGLTGMQAPAETWQQDFTALLAAKEDVASKGQPGGYAGLDADGVVPSAQRFQVVVGSAAEVAAGQATHTIADLDNSVVLAGHRVHFLPGTHTLAASLSLSAPYLLLDCAEGALIDLAGAHQLQLTGDRVQGRLDFVNPRPYDGSISLYLGNNAFMVVSGLNILGVYTPTSSLVLTPGGQAKSGLFPYGYKPQTAHGRADIFGLTVFCLTNWIFDAQGLSAGETYYGVAWANDRFVLVGNGGKVYTSADGIHWTARASGTAANLYAVAFNNGKVAAVGAGGVGIQSGDNGVTWSATNTGTTADLYGLDAVGSYFVAVGAGGAIRRQAYYLLGSIWSVPNQPTAQALHAIAHRNFTEAIAVGDAGTVLFTLDAGASWVVKSAGVANDLFAVAFISTKYMAGGTGGLLLYSSDQGDSWASAAVSNGTAETFRAIAWTAGQGGQIAVAVGTGGAIYLSVDWGESYDRAFGPSGFSLHGLVGITALTGQQQFLAVGAGHAARTLHFNGYAF